MFSKIDKKVLIILIIFVIVILFVGFVSYKYITGSAVKVQDLTGGAQIEKGTSSPVNSAPQVQAQGNNGGDMLSVCLDKCGDGICQKTDPDCQKNNNLNCICLETPQNCPQDCK